MISRMAPVCSASGDELARRHGAQPRVAPAQQRPRPRRLARREVELGLEAERELVALDGAPQLSHQAQPLDAVAVLGRVVEGGAEVALLGDVHRDLGASQQRRRIAAVVGKEGDAEARRDVDAHLLDLDRAGERGLDLAEHRARLGEAARRQQDRELVAAQAGDHQLARAGRPPRSRRASASSR